MKTKKCSTCSLEKDILQFSKNRTKKDGYADQCKKCKAKYQYPKNCQKYQNKLREKVINYLGEKCCQCGYSDKRALHIDHINGGGNKHRKECSWSTFYNDILNKKYEGKIQLLCSNCNMIKKQKNKEYRGV